MVKTNAKKQEDYREQEKEKKNSDYLKKDKERKEQRESFWRNPLHSIKSINEKTVRERLLRNQQNNLSLHQPILLLKNLVSKHVERQNIELANTYHEAQKRESKL